MNVKVIFRISSNNNTFLWKVFPPGDTGWKLLLQTNIPVPDWTAQADTILFLGYLLPKYAEACRCSSYQSRNNKRYKSNLVFQKRVSPNLTSALPPSVQPGSRQETAEVNRTTTSAEAIRLDIDSNDSYFFPENSSGNTISSFSSRYAPKPGTISRPLLFSTQLSTNGKKFLCK